jgi:hypothetical protein
MGSSQTRTSICASCYVLFLLRRFVLVGLTTQLLVLLNRLLILLRGLAGLGWIRGLVWLGGSNIDAGHGIIFRISIWKDFPASLGDVLENRYYKQDN